MFTTAFLDLPPLVSASGCIALPGSKSISNRVLLLAALAQGRTRVQGLLDADDTQVMLTALRQLGCRITQDGEQTVIDGLGGQWPVRQARFFMGNAGTALRPLTALLALLGGDFELAGVARMHQRPVADLVDALRQLGCRIDYLGQDGFPPLRIGRPDLKLDQPICVRGDVSSQFLTALLLALPLVARQAIQIKVAGELISRPYIEITLHLLARFGIQIKRDGWQGFLIPAGSQYRAPGDIAVEADASSASYFIALGAVAAHAGSQNSIKIEGLGQDSIQGDIRFTEAAQAMGAQVSSGPNWLSVTGQRWPLAAIDLDCNHIPDAAMTLAVMALYADGPSTLRNIASWRVKETDRIAAMACELRKLGAAVETGSDFIRITPPATVSDWRPACIHTYDDHRMAMCFALAAFNPAGLPVRIEDPKCVGKTFPDYFEALFGLVQTGPGSIPVICIDGPSASGKGTVAAAVAKRLGYHFLDSGSLYRVTALVAEQAGLRPGPADEAAIATLARSLPVAFDGARVLLENNDVTDAVRLEATGMLASKVSALPAVRQALLALQRGFCRLPGLVADGRDMGSIVFAGAALKVFLTASVQARASRRHKQLISKGFQGTLAALAQDLQARDASDSSRRVAPLVPAQGALLLDNTDLSIEQSVDQVLDWWQARQPFRPGAT